MANRQVSVVDNHTLRLEEDANKGDLIDLNKIDIIDTSIILDKIKEKKDLIYEEKLKQEKLYFETLKDLAVKEALETVEQENIKLKELLKQVEINLKNEHKYELENQKNKHQLETMTLKTELEKLGLKKDDQYKERIHQLDQNIEKLNTEKNNLKLALELEHLKKQTQTKENYEEIIKNKESQIEKLTYERASLNVKRQGENLEKWADNEYNSQNLIEQPHILWEKANEVIKGTKPDFIFKVYATEERKEEELLSSAVLEMKAEDPTSKNKQTNKQFYDKLNKDRLNRNLEYAILVSELEWDTTNDLPVRKVVEYEKMYVIRPQYFMMFLNILTAFGLKYKDILLAKAEERASFKDIEDILTEFETMKDDIINNSIKHISTHIENILKQSVSIEKANDSLKKSADLILETHLETVKNKINQFKIDKITNKVKKI